VIGDCSLAYTSPNAPEVRDVIGTWILSILLRCDNVLPELMGLSKIVSEDSLRRGLQAIPEAEGLRWQQQHIDLCTHHLLDENYIIDIDSTVKPLYWQQQGAVISYNPKSRPSHVHHTYMLAGLRLVLGVGDGTRQRAHRRPFCCRLVEVDRRHPTRLLADLESLYQRAT
jgi:hypothetical protein